MYGNNDGQFKTDLKQALRKFSQDSLADCQLAHSLGLVQKELAAHGLAPNALQRAEALRRILRAGLQTLHESGHAQAASILHQHYVQGELPGDIAEAMHLADSTFYNYQAKAIEKLASLLWERERQASHEPAELRQQLRHLPLASYSRLFGIESASKRLLASLMDADGRGVVILSGMGGVGKTSLAHTTIKQLLPFGFFKDLLWLTARPEGAFPGDSGAGANRFSHDTMVDELINQIPLPDIRHQPIAEKSAALKALLRKTPHIIVIDNLDEEAGLHHILETLSAYTMPSKFLITSRIATSDIRFVQTFPVRSLPPDVAASFMRYHAHERAVTSLDAISAETMNALVSLTGGNPLAIELLIGLLAYLPLERIIDDQTLMQNQTIKYEYDQLFRRSWSLLTESAQQLLLSMLFMPAQGAGWKDLSAISGLSDDLLDQSIQKLIRLSLLMRSGTDHSIYRIHEMTRQYLMSSQDQPGQP
ncbi:MAG: hypothetical protein KDE09_20430 [Anaerolineales bacterium]|nr:hypothetical protein [Anaerolineales bacterium]